MTLDDVKTVARWRSERLGREVAMVRWGSFGQPVLVFPTAGGDAEEIERMHLVGALGPLIEAGKIVLASGEGRAEDLGESWRMANTLGAQGIPNRVDPWGLSWHHDWPTWREMLPKYLGEWVTGA